MTTFGLSADGFSKPELSDILQEILDDLVVILGPGIKRLPPAVVAVLAATFAERESKVWDLAEATYNSQYPDTAVGVQLDNAVQLTGTRRLAATASRQDQILLFGTLGTLVPAGTKFSVDGAPDSIFQTDFDVTLIAGVDEVQRITFGAVPTSGSFAFSIFGQTTALINYNDNAATIQSKINALPALSDVVVSGSIAGGFIDVLFQNVDGKQPWPVFSVVSNTLLITATPVAITPSILTQGVPQGEMTGTATATGPIEANAFSLINIVTPVSGLTRVLNFVDAIPGRARETDAQLRLRRGRSLQIAGNATIDAIRSKLLQLIGVTDAIGFENITELPDLSGRPEKSYEFVVAGGQSQDVTQEIWNTKPAGIRTVGNQTGTAIDTMSQPQIVKWSRPTQVPIYLIVQVVIDPALYPADGDLQIKNNILAFAQSFYGIGVSVFPRVQLVCPIEDIPGIDDLNFLIGTAPSPVTGNNIIINSASQANFQFANISVVHV